MIKFYKRDFLLIIALLFSFQLFAGDYLTNTNQSIRFLRNPARGAAIGIDGVYYNPAGISFLSDGWHLGFNWQQPKQERNIKAICGPLYGSNFSNPGVAEPDGTYSKYFKGKVNIPIQPSMFLSYNKDDWAFQLGFGVLGGGGTCKFNNGIPLFENAFGSASKTLAADSYSLKSRIEGKSYYYGFSFGVSKLLTHNLSMSIGLRYVMASNHYKGSIKDIIFRSARGDYHYPDNFILNAKMTGSGIAPIIGIDYMPTDYLNFSAKYEFRTKIKLKTDAKGNNEPLNKMLEANGMERFLDGSTSYGDMPAQLSCAMQVTPFKGVRVMGEYKHYSDKATNQWNGDLLGNTNEYLCGIEWDVTPRLEISAGFQRTQYSQKDANFSDLSFNLNGNSIGLGVGYKITQSIVLNVAYFRTDYNRHTVKTAAEPGFTSKYIRKNRVLGLGVDIDF